MTNSVDVTCRFNRIEIKRFKLPCHRKVYGKRYGDGTYAVKGKPQNFKKLRQKYITYIPSKLFKGQ